MTSASYFGRLGSSLSASHRRVVLSWFAAVDSNAVGSISADQLALYTFASGRLFSLETCRTLVACVAGEQQTSEGRLDPSELLGVVHCVNIALRMVYRTVGSFPISEKQAYEAVEGLGLPAETCRRLAGKAGMGGSDERISAESFGIWVVQVAAVAGGALPPSSPLAFVMNSGTSEEDPMTRQLEEAYALGYTAEDYQLLHDSQRKRVHPLTEAEKVTVKEAWNKLLAWKDAAIEAFFLRWMLLSGEAEHQRLLGPFLEETPAMFFGLFDLAVRSLQPHCENIAREAYRAVHPSTDLEFNTIPEHLAHFAELGIRPSHWALVEQALLFALETHVPYLEEPEREDLKHPPERSAIRRFFLLHIQQPAIRAIADLRGFLLSHELQFDVPNHWLEIGMADECSRLVMADTFYRRVQQSAELAPYLPSYEHAINHFNVMLNLVIKCARFFPSLRDALIFLGQDYRDTFFPSWMHPLVAQEMLSVICCVKTMPLNVLQAYQRLLGLVMKFVRKPMQVEEQLFKAATAYYQQLAHEKEWSSEDLDKRLTAIRAEIHKTGEYTQTTEEIEYGARVAWRNSAKCIGRISWNTLTVLDRRHVTKAQEMFRECLEHLKLATAGPTIVSVMTVFAPRRRGQLWGPRFWASQFVRYAAYEEATATSDDSSHLSVSDDGQSGQLISAPSASVTGDPANLVLTTAMRHQLGWQPPQRKTAFDLLPAVIELPGQPPVMFEWPAESVDQVAIEHPTEPRFADLGLKWCTVPTISNFRMTLGGVDYCCCPFNGWFMELEVALNLFNRYQVGPAVARLFGIATEGVTHWQNLALCELTRAVYHSFVKNGVTIVDHHSASNQYMVHCSREKAAGREVPAQWSWIGGLVGPACPVWYHEMRDFRQDPQFYYQSDVFVVKMLAATPDVAEAPQSSISSSAAPHSSDHSKVPSRCRILILYGSETGTSETFARKTAKALTGHSVIVATLNDYAGANRSELVNFSHLLVVTSTFGNGDAPENARNFLVNGELPITIKGIWFSVLALGSIAYKNFCAFGRRLDVALQQAGGLRMQPVVTADEIAGQHPPFWRWQTTVVDLVGTPSASFHEERPIVTVTLRPPSIVVDAEKHKVTYVQPNQRGRYVELPVLSNHELLEDGDIEVRSTREITFDATGLNLTFNAGDHLAIRPRTHESALTRFANLLHPPLDLHASIYTVERGSFGERPANLPIPQGISVIDAFAYHWSLRLDESCLENLYADFLVKAQALKVSQAIAFFETQLKGLRGIETDAHATVRQTLAEFVEVSDMLQAWSDRWGLRMAFADLFMSLPAPKDRFYSIAGSVKVNPDRLRICVGVVHTTTAQGKAIKGLSSYYLATLKPGDKVMGFIRPSQFHAPPSAVDPVIFAATGTGLGPLMGFLEERQAAAPADDDTDPVGSLGPSLLFFGCRSRKELLYKDQLHRWKSHRRQTQGRAARPTSVIHALHLAFSREPSVPKNYIQDLMRNSATLVEYLLHPSCRFYFCGDSTVADHCFDALLHALQHGGNMTRMAAVHHLSVMRTQGRYLLDVWGVTMHFEMAREAFLAQERRGAECWLLTFKNPGSPGARDGTIASEMFAARSLSRSRSVSDKLESSLLAAFNSLDLDGNGMLDQHEFREALRSLFPELTEKQFDLYYQVFDKDGNREISFKEFKTATIELALDKKFIQNKAPPIAAYDEARLMRLFLAADTEGRGHISRRQARSVLEGLAPHLSAERSDGLFAAVNPESQTQITFSLLKSVAQAHAGELGLRQSTKDRA